MERRNAIKCDVPDSGVISAITALSFTSSVQYWNYSIVQCLLRIIFKRSIYRICSSNAQVSTKDMRTICRGSSFCTKLSLLWKCLAKYSCTILLYSQEIVAANIDSNRLLFDKNNSSCRTGDAVLIVVSEDFPEWWGAKGWGDVLQQSAT